MTAPTTSRRRLTIAILTILLSQIFTVQGKTYLVSVGISDYPGKKYDLRLPANDAKTIVALYNINSDVESILLLNSDATLRNITTAMTRLYSKAGKDDTVVFFFSGHGLKDGFVAYTGILGYDKIRNAMSQSGCRNKMIFADACYSGKIRGNERKGHISTDTRNGNVMLFLSSRDNEESRERRNMKNGYFTTYLEKGMKGAADTNRDRTITAKELFNYVNRGVRDLSRETQHPVMWGNFPDNMPVMIW